MYFQKRMPMLKPAILTSAGVAAVSVWRGGAAHGLGRVHDRSLPFLGGDGDAAAVNMLVTSAAGQEERGIVTSLYGVVRFTGVAVGPPAFALALAAGRDVMLGAAAGCAALALLLSWWLVKPEAHSGGGGGGGRAARRTERTGAGRESGVLAGT